MSSAKRTTSTFQGHHKVIRQAERSIQQHLCVCVFVCVFSPVADKLSSLPRVGVEAALTQVTEEMEEELSALASGATGGGLPETGGLKGRVCGSQEDPHDPRENLTAVTNPGLSHSQELWQKKLAWLNQHTYLLNTIHNSQESCNQIIVCLACVCWDSGKVHTRSPKGFPGGSLGREEGLGGGGGGTGLPPERGVTGRAGEEGPGEITEDLLQTRKGRHDSMGPKMLVQRSVHGL